MLAPHSQQGRLGRRSRVEAPRLLFRGPAGLVITHGCEARLPTPRYPKHTTSLAKVAPLCPQRGAATGGGGLHRVEQERPWTSSGWERSAQMIRSGLWGHCGRAAGLPSPGELGLQAREGKHACGSKASTEH